MVWPIFDRSMCRGSNMAPVVISWFINSICLKFAGLDHYSMKRLSKKNRQLDQPFFANVSIFLTHFLANLGFFDLFWHFFHTVWNNFWLKGAAPLNIGQKTFQTIKIKLRKIQGCSSYSKKLRTKNKSGAFFDALPHQIGLNK